MATPRIPTKPTMINIPLEVRDWMDRKAVEEDRTLTSIINIALRDAMAKDRQQQRKAG